eukprot:1761088-Pleurochrysis_carterae.AAC.1
MSGSGGERRTGMKRPQMLAALDRSLLALPTKSHLRCACSASLIVSWEHSNSFGLGCRCRHHESRQMLEAARDERFPTPTTRDVPILPLACPARCAARCVAATRTLGGLLRAEAGGGLVRARRHAAR